MRQGRHCATDPSSLVALLIEVDGTKHQHGDALEVWFSCGIDHDARCQCHDIETAVRVGALWLQLEPSDGARLLAAARGLISAARKETIAKGLTAHLVRSSALTVRDGDLVRCVSKADVFRF